MAILRQTVSDCTGLVEEGRVLITLDLPARIGDAVGGLLGEFTRRHMTQAEFGKLTSVDNGEMVETEFTGEQDE
jgi:hypothetical protein